MSDQKTPNVLKQSLLDQINADKKIVEALSDEELESVAGGVMQAISTIANMNTGAAVPERRIGIMNTGAAVPERRIGIMNTVASVPRKSNLL